VRQRGRVVMAGALLAMVVVLAAWIVAAASGWVALGLITWWVSARIAGVAHRC
jgi:hypothetical protein